MNASQKLDVLKDVYEEDAALGRGLEKLLEVTMNDYQLRLKRQEDALKAFEKRYEMSSEAFYRRFEAGELGDDMDFFEWAGLHELQQDLKRKIGRLEQAL